MSGGTGLSRGELRAYVVAPDARLRDRLVEALWRAGVRLAATDRTPDTVIVAAAGTVDEAVDACAPAHRSGGYRLLVVADRFRPAGVLRAVRSGVRAMLRSADATPQNLAAAVRAAHHGDGRIPHEVLVGLLGGRAAAERPALRHPRSPLTARQTMVLALIAEGQGNAEIARSLSCSEHTVKNVIYELMARLQVRNRAHAVACAVRRGLI